MEFWIVDADGFAGRFILGLKYIPTETRLGHHIGCAIRPTKRLRGYASRSMEMVLDEARALGITPLMPECDATNVASQKLIERNGGVKLEAVPGKEGSLRYLIELL